MFTRQELITELPRLTAASAPPLEIVDFSHQDFESPSSEQLIWAFRGLKRDFANLMLFWVKTLQAQGFEELYFRPCAEAAPCDLISANQFAALVTRFTVSLRQPIPRFLTELDGFQSGLQMSAEWNDVAALAELPDSFVAFYWSTSA